MDRRTHVQCARVHVHRRRRRLVADDIARVSCFEEFTSPILEGLALYSEHDVTVGGSPVIGRATFLAGLMFAGRQADPINYINLIPQIIHAGRTTQANVRRKADLLMQPICGTRDGYLAGYLYIHFLHSWAMQKSGKYVDTDFFLHVLRCWFYEDWDLVDILLANSTDYDVWMEGFVLYYQEMMAKFCGLSDDRVLAEFEKRGLEKKPEVFEYTGAHLKFTANSFPVVSSKINHPGKSKLKALFNDVFGTCPSDPEGKDMFESNLDLLALRSTITLGHGEFAASVTSGRMFQLRVQPDSKLPVFSTQSPEEIKPGWRQQVDVDLILSTAPPGMTQIVTDPQSYIAGFSFGASNRVPPSLRSAMANWEKRKATMERQDKKVTQLLNGSTEELLLQITTERVRGTREAVFELRGQMMTPDKLLPGAKVLMAEDGFLPVWNGSLKLILDAAAISLSAALRMDPSAAFPEWVWTGTDHLTTARTINSLFSQRLGYEPFRISNSKIMFSMI